jgi:hypothetical protein
MARNNKRKATVSDDDVGYNTPRPATPRSIRPKKMTRAVSQRREQLEDRLEAMTTEELMDVLYTYDGRYPKKKLEVCWDTRMGQLTTILYEGSAAFGRPFAAFDDVIMNRVIKTFSGDMVDDVNHFKTDRFPIPISFLEYRFHNAHANLGDRSLCFSQSMMWEWHQLRTEWHNMRKRTLRQETMYTLEWLDIKLGIHNKP